MAQEKTLQELCDELQKKAEERGCNLICICDFEDKDGLYVGGTYEPTMMSDIIANATETNEQFRDLFERATLEVSVRKLNELLKQRNPLASIKI